ncbi:ImmA/IrrE family metallo-endopeptidase [Nocardia aurantia]|uniref:IrrE N-terminal-like domain-containing protein n=1 Tax=Nocardia aurantia TaxID=2585199 RepID=A0A7K0DNB6_9NOCA|nr:ImmA/IrrE family metallo-endopeptidase [Nocardia aurantia]MQY27236.1 hypothetical protein [Nocardia aurantia]
MPPHVRRDAVAIASMQAARLHQQMHTPYDRPVDVFGLTQRLGLWLATQPLDHTYGFYLSEGPSAGIVLNSNHPETLQRYTCAHELGHHLLGHGSRTDDSNTVDRNSDDLALKELQAQVFAAALLMPAPLVNRTLQRLGITGVPGAPDIYAASRDMAVSYTAALWGLAQLKKLDFGLLRALEKSGAKSAKDALRGGPAVTDARADVWIVDNTDRDAVHCRVGDEIHLHLPEDLSTGHTWTIDHDTEPAPAPSALGMHLQWDGGTGLGMTPAAPAAVRPRSAGLDILTDIHQPATRPQPAAGTQDYSLFDLDSAGEDRDFDDFILPAPGIRIIVVSPHTTGEHTVRVSLRPAWDTTSEPAAQRRLLVTAGPRKTLPEQGLAPRQIERRIQELAAA